jgi:hypothetical protein
MTRQPTPGRAEAVLDQVIVRGADTLMIGPIVYVDDQLYFVVVSGQSAGGEPHIMQMRVTVEEHMAEEARRSLALASAFRAGLVIHLFDDELPLARIGEAIWPARFAPIRQSIEQERAAGSAATMGH